MANLFAQCRLTQRSFSHAARVFAVLWRMRAIRRWFVRDWWCTCRGESWIKLQRSRFTSFDERAASPKGARSDRRHRLGLRSGRRSSL